MLRWLSSKHRRNASSSSTNSFYRVSLDLPSDAVPAQSNSTAAGDNSKAASRASSAVVAVPDNGKKIRAFSSLRRRSLPALHLQEDQSAAMMTNPPVFTNPLRRRGCCDHQHTEQMYQYRAEAIEREQASQQASFRLPLEAA